MEDIATTMNIVRYMLFTERGQFQIFNFDIHVSIHAVKTVVMKRRKKNGRE